MSLITPFDPWRSKLCTCPLKYNLSPFTGCGHGCLYCYASSYIPKFNQPRVKKDFTKRLKKEIKKIPPSSIITISNSSDPYQPLEAKERLMKETLRIIPGDDFKINIVTKSSLIKRDIALLNKFKNIVICISLTTLSEKLSEKLEPGAPSPKKRLDALKTLSGYFPTVVRLDPLIYPLNTGEIEEIIKAVRIAGAKQIITSTYKAKPDNFKKMCAVFSQYSKIWQKLYKEEGKSYGKNNYLTFKLRKKMIERVKETALKYGAEFSSCREGLEKLNTLECDGSFWLNSGETNTRKNI
ncbi:MAG: radical SAM protein [Candidatus Omnitrophica bacterium]|nr:radical SAM protein [Candidatus Omnitrophota bacterium]MBD3268922.1 radical SAM protein [Candidatus Omnitrophota bacterium]